MQTLKTSSPAPYNIFARDSRRPAPRLTLGIGGVALTLILVLWAVTPVARALEAPASAESSSADQVWRQSQTRYDRSAGENRNALSRWQLAFDDYQKALHAKKNLWHTLFSARWILAIVGTLMAVVSSWINVYRVSRNDQSIRQIEAELARRQTRTRQISEALQTWQPTVGRAVQFLAVAPLSGKLTPSQAETEADRILLDAIVPIRRAQLGQPVSAAEPSPAEKTEAITYLGAHDALTLMAAVDSVLIPKAQALRDELEQQSLSDNQKKEALMRNSYAQRNFAAGLQIIGTVTLLAKDLF